MRAADSLITRPSSLSSHLLHRALSLTSFSSPCRTGGDQSRSVNRHKFASSSSPGQHFHYYQTKWASMSSADSNPSPVFFFSFPYRGSIALAKPCLLISRLITRPSSRGEKRRGRRPNSGSPKRNNRTKEPSLVYFFFFLFQTMVQFLISLYL